MQMTDRQVPIMYSVYAFPANNSQESEELELTFFLKDKQDSASSLTYSMKSSPRVCRRACSLYVTYG
jgi:hypothetical protein